jgi:hypothetical protein
MRSTAVPSSVKDETIIDLRGDCPGEPRKPAGTTGMGEIEAGENSAWELHSDPSDGRRARSGRRTDC